MCMTLKVNEGALGLDDFRFVKGEQRREPRTPVFAKPVWVFVPEESPRTGHLVDCSPHGIGLLLQVPLRDGQHIGLKLRLDRLRLVTYTVRHCRPEGEQFRIGALLSGVDGRQPDDQLERVFRTLIEAGAPPIH